MHKDIIYIDTEDDITAIIGKIKASSDKIIALVPPKRAGVLQSAVNMRLLSKTAEKADKHLVIITNDKALVALSASAKIPVARNLQSKPEVAEIPALEIDEGEDVIEGAELPVGELMKMAGKQPGEDDVVKVMHDINIDGESVGNIEETGSESDVKPKSAKSKVKVPDFSNFRKKLFIGIFGGIILVAFLVWAFIFAPYATVIITAKTQPAPVSLVLKLGDSQATDISKNIVQSLAKTVVKDITVDFTATSSQLVGVKATGTLTLTNFDFSTEPFDVSAGTIFTNSGFQFLTKSVVTVPGFTKDQGVTTPGVATVDVDAVDIGADFNLPAGSYSSSDFSGLTVTGTTMVGGESHQGLVVLQEDIDKAKTTLQALSTLSIKNQLKSQFTNQESIIDSSFTATYGDFVSTPVVGKEATNGKATLTSKTTFSLTAIAKAELESYLKDAINKQIVDSKTQKMYDNGFGGVKLTNYAKGDSLATVNVAASGKIGPNIDEALIKQQVKGKGYGDVQQLLEGKNGIGSVDIKFSYFWVRTVPGDVNKIDIQFELQNG